MIPRILLAAAVFLATSPTSAQYREYRGYHDPDRTGTVMVPRRAPVPYGYYGAPVGPVCQAWCNADLNPCDPPEFKVTDGRCSHRDD